VVPAPSSAAAAPLRIGLFGGTFDPPHIGHATVAGDVADALALDRVLWIPAGYPPHKSREDLTPAPLRLEMVREATVDDARFAVSAAEIRREGPSYTVDTVREIREVYPEAELFLILGADQFASFQSWRAPEEILRMATLVVMDRNGVAAPDHVPDVPGAERAQFVPVTRVDVSSTQIRNTIAQGGHAAADLQPEVAAFIDAEGLYRK
jgi:nicotinate-nucleotide adenylyltransferase